MGMPYEKVAMLVAVVCAVLFTVLLGNNFIEEAPVAVIDLDNSKYSHELIQEMDASPYIDINTVFHSAVNPKALFYRDRFAAVVYFPKDLEKNRYSEAAGQIGVFYDNTSIAQNADIMEALNTIVAEENNKLSAPETSRAERGITLRDRLLFNPQGSAAFSFISPASSVPAATSREN
jgi:ABC-2 type transport system permease protein